VTQNTDELCLHADEPLKRYGRCEKKETDQSLVMVMSRSRYEVTIGNAVLLMLNCSTVQSLPMHKKSMTRKQGPDEESRLSAGKSVNFLGDFLSSQPSLVPKL